MLRDSSITPAQANDNPSALPSKKTSAIVLNEAALDTGLTHFLDSLSNHEIACLAEQRPHYWLLGQWKDDLFEFTGTGSFSENALGFVEVKGEIVFLYKKLPEATTPTGKQRTFHRVVYDAPPPTEDYSVWYLRLKGDEAQIVESYTLPCD